MEEECLRIGTKTLSKCWWERISKKLLKMVERKSSLNSMHHGVDIANSWLLSGTNWERNTRTMRRSSSPKWTPQPTKLKTSKSNHSLPSSTSLMERSSITKVDEPLKILSSFSIQTVKLKTAPLQMNQSQQKMRNFRLSQRSQRRKTLPLLKQRRKTNSRQLITNFLGDFLNFASVGVLVVGDMSVEGL